MSTLETANTPKRSECRRAPASSVSLANGKTHVQLPRVAIGGWISDECIGAIGILIYSSSKYYVCFRKPSPPSVRACFPQADSSLRARDNYSHRRTIYLSSRPCPDQSPLLALESSEARRYQ